MKKTCYFIPFCLFLTTGVHLSNAQVIQDKLYIFNSTCFAPQVEGKIGQVQYGPVNGENPLRQTRREFPVGLLSASGNSIKYTIYEGKVFAASFEERNDVYRLGPAIIAIDTSGFRPLDTAFSRRLLAVTGRTGHAIHHNTFLDGKPLRLAIIKSDFKRLVYDFTANESGLYLYIHEKDSMKVLRILPKGKELVFWGSGVKSMQEEKEKNKSELVAASEVAGEVSSISAFSIKNELYVFIHDDGRIFHISNSGVNAVISNIKSTQSYKDYALIVDRDKDRVILLPKQAIQEIAMSFNEIIRRYGTEVKLN